MTPRLRLSADEVAEAAEIHKHFRGTCQQPAADLLHRHSADQVDRHPQAMSKGQLALRAGAAPGVTVPVTDDGVAAPLDEIQIISDDLAYRLLKAWQVVRLPATELTHFGFRQVLLLVFRGIVNFMA